MINYNLAIQKILIEIDKFSGFEDKLTLIKQAIQIADANNDLDWGVDLRLDLIHYEGFTAQSNESFPAFAWLLNTCDSDPDLFDSTNLLQRYKWLIHSSFDQLGISNLQLKNILADYLRRLVDAGYSKRSYYDIEVSWSLFIGDVKRARQYLEYRNAESVDRMSSNNEIMTDICVELLDHNFDKGISMTQEFISNNPEEKRPMYCILVYYLGIVGDSRVKDYFEEAEKCLSQEDKYPYMLFEVSQLLYYLAKYNKDKAWYYFEQYAHWQIDANDYYTFDFSLAVLPLFENDEKKELSLSSKFPFYKEDGIYNTKDLYQYYSENVRKFGSKFDQRNGNTYFQKQVNQYLDSGQNNKI